MSKLCCECGTCRKCKQRVNRRRHQASLSDEGKQKRKDYQKRRYLEKREEIAQYMRDRNKTPEIRAGLNEYQAKWREANRDHVNAQAREYRARRKEAVAANWRKYRAANAGKVNAQARKYRAANPDKVNAATLRWKQANPEAVRANNQLRRSRRAGATGTVTARELRDLFNRQGGKCAGCKKRLGKVEDGGWHHDHVMPLALGGENTIENSQILCQPCNGRKHAKHPQVWAAELGRLFA